VSKYDVIFLHPSFILNDYSITGTPSDAITVPGVMMPMGMFSLASFLEDYGLRTKIVNLGIEKMLTGCTIEEIINNMDAKNYAIDLHWTSNSLSAIHTAKICKNIHPESTVILGGMTASYYAEEILQSFPFIDVIVVGEAEYPIASLANNGGLINLDRIDGITYRIGKDIKSNNPSMPVNIDSFDFVRLKVLDHSDMYIKFSSNIYSLKNRDNFWLNIARSCPFNCSYCGGSSYGYKSLTGRQYPVVRNPKVVLKMWPSFVSKE
jgi:radical SAM superfamily enzyme YgiQ (UPF0313 family)